MQTAELKVFESSFNQLSETEKQLLLDSGYSYIFSKAYRFLEVGPDAYRQSDYFEQPSTKISEELEILKKGCRQILECRGLIDKRAFMDLDVTGFSQLMTLFHYKSVKRKTTYKFEIEGKKGILDAITFSHVVNGDELVLYNFCTK